MINRNIRLLAGLSAAALIMGASAAAMAQAQPPGPPPAGAWKEHAERRGAERIHALHDLLNIHPDQETAFQAFVAAIRPHHHDEAGPPAAPTEADQAALTTPQRLDRVAAMISKRQAVFQARADATRTFYAALSPEQQRAFDALPLIGFGGELGERGHGPGGQWRGRGPGDPDAPPPPPPPPGL